MSKNFKVRLVVSIALIAVLVLSLYTFDGIPFKILAAFFVAVAALELLSFLKQKKTTKSVILLFCELIFLFCGLSFACQLGTIEIWYIIVGVCGYDIFAYAFGHVYGGKIFKKSRPFPKISKGKTWEGTILGLITSICLVIILMHFTHGFAWPFLLCSPLALCGDLFESYLKRQFGVKDSNEIIIKRPLFAKIELLVGGKDGHGGFLDRIDSLAFTATALLLIFLCIG